MRVEIKRLLPIVETVDIDFPIYSETYDSTEYTHTDIYKKRISIDTEFEVHITKDWDGNILKVILETNDSDMSKKIIQNINSFLGKFVFESSEDEYNAAYKEAMDYLKKFNS
jgi:hypothetical protein